MNRTLNITFYLITVVAMLLAIMACAFSFAYPQKYSDLIRFYAAENDLNPALVSSIINAESRYDPNAESSAGALGLMQLLPSTANWLAGVELSKEEIIEPNTNISLGCRYLFQLINQFSNLDCVLAAYNAGPNKVLSWLSDSNFSTDGITLQNIPFNETAKYIIKVKNNLKVYQFLMK